MPTPYGETRSQKICSIESTVVICFIVSISMLVLALGLTYYNVPDTPAQNLDKLDNDLWITMNVDQMWENFKARFNKSYGEEGERKFEVFKVNLRTYLEAGRKNPLALLSFTKFSDLNESAGELLDITGLNSDVQRSEVVTPELEAAKNARNQASVGAPQNKGGGGGATPFTSVRRGTALWGVAKEKPIGAFKTPQRHGHAFRVKNAIRRATKDPYSVTSNLNKGNAGRRATEQQTDDGATARNIWVSGFCNSNNNLWADGLYTREGFLPNGYPYYRHIPPVVGDKYYYLFYDAQCTSGALGSWRLVRQPVDPSRTTQVVPYAIDPWSCTAQSNVQVYKPEKRVNPPKVPHEGSWTWNYRGECTGHVFAKRVMTMVMDTYTWTWQYEGKVSPVQHQGSCGSCWAFAGVAAVESAWLIGAGSGGNPHEPLSDQVLLDCEDDYYACHGGNYPKAITETIQKNAARFGHSSYGGGLIPIKSDYATEANSGNPNPACSMDNNKKIGAVINSVQRPLLGLLNQHGGGDHDRWPHDIIMQQALQTGGPLFVSVFTNGHAGWMAYNGGIMTNCQSTPYHPGLDMYFGDHAVVIVGFGTDKTGATETPYWILKNSWGIDWGEGGFSRVAKGANPPCVYTPYLYTAADPVEAPIESERTGTANMNKGRIIRRQRATKHTCHAMCAAELACEGFHWYVAGSDYHKDCLLRTELETATENVPHDDIVDTLFTLQSDLRAEVHCEPFGFSNHPMTALNSEVFKPGFTHMMVGGKDTYWSTNFYMYWCREQASWHIAYIATWPQNQAPGACNAIARKGDPSHYSTEGGWWYFNPDHQWWEGTPNVNINCGGCNTFVLLNIPGQPTTDNVLGSQTWTADFSKMAEGKPTYWSGGRYLWFARNCVKGGWWMESAANYPPDGRCSGVAFSSGELQGSQPYQTRSWMSAYSQRPANQPSWWEESSRFWLIGVCTGTATAGSEYCEACEGRNLSLPGVVNAPGAERHAQVAQVDLPCDQFKMSGFTTISELNGHMWYREDSKQVSGQPTWWTGDLASGLRYYIFYCPASTEWRVVNEAKWVQHANYAPNCNPYKVATAITLPAASGSVNFTETVRGSGNYSETGASVSVSITSDCAQCQMHDVHGFEDASLNDFYHEIASKTVGGAVTYWHPNGQYFLYQCKRTGDDNTNRWLLSPLSDWASASAGSSCNGLVRHTSPGSYTPLGSVSDTSVWEGMNGGSVNGGVTCITTGFCPSVEVRGIYDKTSGSNGWYERDTSKMSGDKPTYWLQDDSWFMYYCSSLSVWHLRPGADWATVSNGQCMPETEQNRLRANLAGSNHFAYPRTGNWQLYSDGSWQTQNTGTRMMTVACRYPDAFKVDGFTNPVVNAHYLRRDTHYKNNMPTFWSDDHQVFAYYCRQSDQWAIATGSQWSHIKNPRSSCDSIAFKAGPLTRPMTGDAIWTEYVSGTMSPVAHELTAGDCNRTIMAGFRQNNLNQVFQKWEGQYTITGMPSYYSPAAQFQVMYWCNAANRWHITQYTESGAQAVIADEALQANCPHTARKSDNSPLLSSGGWEEKCTPGQYLVRDGAHGNFSMVCAGSPIGDDWNSLGTQASPEDCRSRCESVIGCEYAVFNRDTQACAQFASCPSNTLATASSPHAIIAVCPPSGYTTTASVDPVCEEADDIRVTEQGCRCQKMWAYDNVDVTNYCGIPDPAVESRDWCFVIDRQCQAATWGYCTPAVVPSEISDGAHGSKATPVPPHVAVADSVRKEVVDVRAHLNENLPATCCDGKFNFTKNAGDAAIITENGMNIDVKMHLMADGEVLSNHEEDLVKTLATALLVSDSRVKLTRITAGVLMRGFAELAAQQYTIQFYVKNTSGGASSGLEGWHIALIILVSVVVLLALVVVVMYFMFSSQPDAVGLVKADIRDINELDEESEEMHTPTGQRGQVARNRDIMRLARAGGLKGGYDPFNHKPLADGSPCPLESSRTDASRYAEHLDYCPCCGGGKKLEDDGDCKSARSEEDKEENLWDNLRSGNRLRSAYERLIAFRMKQLLKKHLRGGREARRGPKIDFEDLAVVVRDGLSGTKIVLQQCNGVIQPGRVTAVMGPSGAGKTSFLHALAGRVPFVGKVKANSHEKTRPELRKLVGFVPQNDDSLLGDMTVKENIEHNARIRSSNRTDEEVDDATASMINLLSLNTCQDTPVGTAEKRGVSGGQKKRACIAAELVAEPQVLFLDEPTSGLDTHSSMLVCSLLKNLAEHSGVTIVASIHQPSAAMLRQFHNLILLSPGTIASPGQPANPGGRLAYAGPNVVALTYFDRVIGIPCTSLAENDTSNFFMLALSGQLERGGHVGKDGEKQWRHITSMELEARWSNFAAESQSEIFGLNAGGEYGVEVTDAEKHENPEPHPLAPWCLQLLLFFNRFVVRNFRLWKERAIDAALFAVAGCYTGLLFVGQEYMSPECMPPCDLTALDDVVSGVNEGRSTTRIKEFLELAVDPFATQAGFVVLGVSVCAAVADLRVFNTVRHVYRNEVGQGLSATAFFLAMDIANFLWIALSPLAFIIPYWMWATQAGLACAPFWGYYEVVLPIAFTASGLAYAVSTVVPRENSQLAVVVIILVSLRLYDIRDLEWLRYFTFMRWAQEAFYLQDYICLTERARDSHGTFKVGLPAKHAQSTSTPWDPEGFPEALGWLWAWGFFFRFCAWLSLNVQQHAGMDWD